MQDEEHIAEEKQMATKTKSKTSVVESQTVKPLTFDERKIYPAASILNPFAGKNIKACKEKKYNQRLAKIRKMFNKRLAK